MKDATFYSVSETAELVGLSRKVVWEAARDGKIRATRPIPGGSYRIPKEEVERMLEPVKQEVLP